MQNCKYVCTCFRVFFSFFFFWRGGGRSIVRSPFAEKGEKGGERRRSSFVPRLFGEMAVGRKRFTFRSVSLKKLVSPAILAYLVTHAIFWEREKVPKPTISHFLPPFSPFPFFFSSNRSTLPAEKKEKLFFAKWSERMGVGSLVGSFFSSGGWQLM